MNKTQAIEIIKDQLDGQGYVNAYTGAKIMRETGQPESEVAQWIKEAGGE